jgi:hypothetical protein
MAAKIKSEVAVGVTDEIKSALEVVENFCGLKPSQFGRQAILEKLCREGYLRHPGFARYENQAQPNLEINNAHEKRL